MIDAEQLGCELLPELRYDYADIGGSSTTLFGAYNNVLNGINNKCDVDKRDTARLTRG